MPNRTDQGEVTPGPAVNRIRPRRRRWMAGKLALVVVGLLLIVSVVYRPPYLVIAPGPVVDLTNDISIEGVPSRRPEGTFLLVSVRFERLSALKTAAALLNPELDVVPESSFIKPGVSDAEYFRLQKAVFLESQMTAAAAAARASGMPVTLQGQGARISNIFKGSPAQGRLRVGDLITAAGGAPIRVVSDLTALTTLQPAGTVFDLQLVRRGKQLKLKVSSARLKGFNATGTGIGVITTTEGLKVDLPFRVRFRDQDLAGPSAGLVYALTMVDMLGRAEVAGNRVIAASGSIQLDGRVGLVGGLEQKSIAARRAGAQLFLVPKAEIDRVPNGTVRGVESLEDALSVLAAS